MTYKIARRNRAENAVKHQWGLVSDRRGATAAEFALLLGLICSALAIASTKLGASIGCSIESAAATIAEQKFRKKYGNSDPNGNAYGQRRNC